MLMEELNKVNNNNYDTIISSKSMFILLLYRTWAFNSTNKYWRYCWWSNSRINRSAAVINSYHMHLIMTIVINAAIGIGVAIVVMIVFHQFKNRRVYKSGKMQATKLNNN